MSRRIFINRNQGFIVFFKKRYNLRIFFATNIFEKRMQSTLITWIFGLLVIGSAHETSNIITGDDETVVVVTHFSQNQLRSYGQHTKSINEAYCSR